MIAAGEEAPDFDGPTSTGTRFHLAGERGHPVVLYFFPKADTPGCTAESKGFQEHLGELGGRDVRVVGVSTDSLEAQKKFSAKYGFEFPLVADPEKEIARKYGVLGLLGMAKRVTFLIGADGRVRQVIDRMGADPHVAAACDRSWSAP